mgnify:CR=1 FL=1
MIFIYKGVFFMYSCSYPINNNYSTTYYPTNDYNFSNNRIIPGAGGFLLPFRQNAIFFNAKQHFAINSIV